MWIWLDKNGTVKQYLTHGPSPIVGETDFQIFAYFDGLDTEFFDSATIKFRKPDRQGSTYPVLFMKKTNLDYERLPGDGTMTNFDPNKNPYTGFLFDFSDFIDGDEVVRLLDTPGLWEATITVLGSPNKTNVSGLITFEVGQSASDSEDESELSLDHLLQNMILSASILKKNSTYYLKVCENFAQKAHDGELDRNVFSLGSIVFDESSDDFYKITSVTANEQDVTKVFVTYENIFDYVRFASVPGNTTLRAISAINNNEAVFLSVGGKDYIAHVITKSNKSAFDIIDIALGVRYHGENVSADMVFADAVSDPYYVFGVYYQPTVSEDGDISWSNSHGLPNPPTVNIKGPKGDTGPEGPQGPTGIVINTGGDLFAFSVEDGNLMVSWPDGARNPTEYLSIDENGDLIYTY